MEVLIRAETNVFPTQFNFDNELVIAVLSARENFQARDSIRKTWAKNMDNIFFMTGIHTCPYPIEWRVTSQGCDLNPDFLEKLYFPKFHGKTGQSLAANFETADLKLDKNDNILGLTFEEEELWLNYNFTQQEVNQKLIAESQILDNKLILLDMQDTYDHLTLKTKKSLEWAWNHMSSDQVEKSPQKYFLKIDDDCLVRPKSYEAFLKNFFPPSDFPFLYYGKLRFQQKIVLHEGKWAEKNYHEEFYPIYADGNSGYVLSFNILKELATEVGFDNLVEYHNEDASVGIWLKNTKIFDQINYIKIHKRNLLFFYDHQNPDIFCSPYMAEKIKVNNRKSFDKTNYMPHTFNQLLVIGHKLNAQEILDCWESYMGGKDQISMSQKLVDEIFEENFGSKYYEKKAREDLVNVQTGGLPPDLGYHVVLNDKFADYH